MAKRRASPTAEAKSFVISIRAKPRSHVSVLEPGPSGSWIARLRASPVEGEANSELLSLVAKHFGCARSAVSVISGVTSRLKLVRISGTVVGQTNAFVAPDVPQPASPAEPAGELKR